MKIMDLILQQSINAISLGGVYAMLALGLAIVFSIVRLINFAHGEIMTFGGYGIFLALTFGMPPLGALAMGVGAAVIMALAMERTAFRAMRGADVVTLLITSFAVSEILKVLFQNGISARPVPISLPQTWSGTYQIGGTTIGVIPTASIIVALTALLGLTLILRKTATGMAMRAAAEDLEMLKLLGIRANRVVAFSFALSGLLAGIAAVIWTAQRGSVDPMMGFFQCLRRLSRRCLAAWAASAVRSWGASSSAGLRLWRKRFCQTASPRIVTQSFWQPSSVCFCGDPTAFYQLQLGAGLNDHWQLPSKRTHSIPNYQMLSFLKTEFDLLALVAFAYLSVSDPSLL